MNVQEKQKFHRKLVLLSLVSIHNTEPKDKDGFVGLDRVYEDWGSSFMSMVDFAGAVLEAEKSGYIQKFYTGTGFQVQLREAGHAAVAEYAYECAMKRLQEQP